MLKLRKIEITTGIYWIEIPEVNLRILCGCPEDSVKHLARKGFIQEMEMKGVKFESGPNAILLSDILIQNGQFSNLAEFPVLQMLYFQGMILPGHINNNGSKPIIIGSEEQVASQMEYIFRGNYGLTTLEELKEAGASSEEAEELMRLKLKFAFGTIRNTEELLSPVIVGEGRSKIRDGVTIRRTQVNQFEIEYAGESVHIDLALKGREFYDPPYQLGYSHIDREYFSVIHLGGGDGWDQNRPCMGSILLFQGKIYLIDAGPNISYILKALGIDSSEIEGIFHTHAHDDHFAGLPSLIRVDHKIKYYATPMVRSSVEKKLAALTSFPRKLNAFFEVCDLKEGEWNNVSGLEVKPLLSPHPIETTIFFFQSYWEEGYKTYAHLADTVALNTLKEMVTSDKKELGVSQAFYERIKKSYTASANLKKIDIGGGLIHGSAEDFREDESEVIILCHTSKRLTNRQKEIGSNAPFATSNVLIKGEHDYLRNSADSFLFSYFPTAPPFEVQALLNCPIISLNPGSILMKKGEQTNYLYLILSGVVEAIDVENEDYLHLPAGSLIGEFSVLHGCEAKETYRTSSFVRALKIPGNLYVEFAIRSNLLEELEAMRQKRVFLQKAWLFMENVPYAKQNFIAQNMQQDLYEKGDRLPSHEKLGLYILMSGKIEILYQSKVIQVIGPNDFYGEDTVVDLKPSSFEAIVLETTKICFIEAEKLNEIPCVYWKLCEVLEKRKRLVKDSTN